MMPVVAGPARELLERERELTGILEALGAARAGRGQLVLVEGQAGLGKSRLLGAAQARAQAGGFDVLRARGSDLERSFPFGVALQLFEPCVALAAQRGEADRLLSGAAGLAASLLRPVAPVPPGTTADRAASLLHGLFWLTSNLADERPLLVSVDDAHWADALSQRFLVHLAGNLADLPVVLMAAFRPAEPGVDTNGLDRLVDRPGARVLRPAPLSGDAVEQVVRASVPGAGEELVRAAERSTGGNPFYLGELLVELAGEESAEPAELDRRRVERLHSGGVARAVLARVARLPESAGRLARAAAVLGDAAPRERASALAGLHEDEVAAAIHALVQTDVLARGDRLHFAHPIVRASIYEALPPAERARWHGSAARHLHDRGAPVDEVATHLLKAPAAAEAWVVGALRAAAASARARGAPDVAAACLRRALAEPPEPALRGRVLADLADAAAAAGEPEAADWFAQAVERAEVAETRATLLLRLSRHLFTAGRYAEALAALERAAAQAGDGDSPLAREIDASWVTVAMLELERRPEALERAARVIERTGAGSVTPGERGLLANLALQRLFAGEPIGPGRDLALRALDGGRLLEDEGADSVALYVVTGALLAADELALELEVLDAALEDARRRGSAMAFATASYCRAWPHLLRGAVDAAVADAQHAVDAGGDGWELFLGAAHSILGLALIERGDLDAAERALHPDGAERWHATLMWPMLLEARARLSLAQGEGRRAARDAEAAGHLLVAATADSPVIVPWRVTAALGWGRVGDTARAQELAAEQLERARTFGSDRALGNALRLRGLVQGGSREAGPPLREAVAHLERSQASLELAHALLDLGAALRREGRRAEAATALERALGIAEAGGARPLARRARDELVAAGTRNRDGMDDAATLTPRERRVAELAVEGLSNRAIAQALFVTVKAVEWHLGNVYGKLGIRSRQELSGALGRTPLARGGSG